MATTAMSRGARGSANMLVLLLGAAVFLNYVDRGAIAVAAPLMKAEFSLSDSELGILFAAFFATYTAMQFIVGWLVDLWDANHILAAGFLLWSLATSMTGVVRGFAMLLTLRLILGIGESVALPSGSKILAQHLPEHSRGLASGALMSAIRCGNAVGTLGPGLLMAKFGWRPVFITLGLISLPWLAAWKKWMPRGGQTVGPNLKFGPGFQAILSQRSFWGTCSGHFAANYLFYFMITWLPSYLVRERHLPLVAMTGIAGLYYAVDAASAVLSGWLQDYFIAKHYPSTVVRKAAMAIGFSLAAVAVTGCVVTSATFLPWLLAAGVGCGITGPGLYTFPQTLAGPGAVGKWYGWQNGFANFAGVLGPSLTGFVLQQTRNFLAPFLITAGICVMGALAWVCIVGRVEAVDWASKRAVGIERAGA